MTLARLRGGVLPWVWSWGGKLETPECRNEFLRPSNGLTINSKCSAHQSIISLSVIFLAPRLATSVMSVHFKVFLWNHPWVVLLFVELLSQAHISGIWRSTQGLLLGRVSCLISSSMAAILKFESIYEWGTLHSHTLAGPALMQERKKISLAFFSGYRCELNKVFDSKKT